jgi:hypothetical protein
MIVILKKNLHINKVGIVNLYINTYNNHKSYFENHLIKLSKLTTWTNNFYKDIKIKVSPNQLMVLDKNKFIK